MCKQLCDPSHKLQASLFLTLKLKGKQDSIIPTKNNITNRYNVSSVYF